MKSWGVLKTVAVVAGIFVLVWAAALLYWYAADREPGPLELGLLLLGLPLLLIGGVALLTRKSSQDPGPATVTSEPTPAVPARRRSKTILAGAVELPIGNEPAAILEASRGPVAAELHAQLRNRGGMPVFAAQVADIDISPVESLLAPGLVSGERRDPELIRALALSSPVLASLLESAATELEEAGDDRAIAIHLLLPVRWSASDRDLVEGVIKDAASAHLGDVRLTTRIHAISSGAEALTLLGTPVPEPAHERTPRHLELWLAMDSFLGARSVARLEGTNQLLGAGNPEGFTLGEAAAGVLMSGDPPDPSIPVLVLVEHSAMDNPDARPSDQTRHLTQLMTSALEHGAREPGQITLVISDADHRPSRTLPLGQAIQSALPELDVEEDCVKLGQGCGHAAAVTAVAAVATAAEHVRTQGTASLVVSLNHERDRAVAVISPPPVAASASI